VEMFVGSLWLDGSGQRMLPGIATAFDPTHEAAWVDSQYVSPLVWVLALTALGGAAFRTRFRWLGGAWLLLCTLWLGRHLPIAGWFHSLPLWGSFRYPEKLSPWLLMGLALAAAVGLEQLVRSEASRRTAARLSGIVAGLLALFGAVELATGGFSHLVGRWAVLTPAALAQLHSNAVLQFTVSAGLCLVLAGLLQLSKTRPGALALIRVVVAVHLVMQGTGLYWLTSVDTLRTKPELLQHVTATDDVRPRVLSRVGTAKAPDDFEKVSVPTFMAFTTAESLRPLTATRWGVQSLAAYLPAAHPALDKSEEELQAFAPLWGTQYVITREAQAVDRAQMLATFTELKLKLWKFENARPRAYLSLAEAAGNGALTAAQAAALSLTAPPRSRIAPAPEKPGAKFDLQSLGTVTWLRYASERVELDVNALADSYLVLNDAAHPGWEATVDGKSAPLLLANDVARAVAISKGSHQVVMTYSTPGLKLGLTVSLLAWVGLVAFALLGRKKPENTPAPSGLS
jgi:hypothetical protein